MTTETPTYYYNGKTGVSQWENAAFAVDAGGHARRGLASDFWLPALLFFLFLAGLFGDDGATGVCPFLSVSCVLLDGFGWTRALS